jgi:hypothetical protein
MERLSNLELEKELEIHGLLVGRNQSTPLEMICTSWDRQFRVHNFLCKYDPIMLLKAKNNLNKINDDGIDNKYNDIEKFKDLSDQMSQMYNDNIAPSLKQEAHLSKYDKKKSKLKSSSKLYAHKNDEYEDYNETRDNAVYHSIQNRHKMNDNFKTRVRYIKSTALKATMEDITDNEIEFNYLFIYKKALNIAKEEIKKKNLDLIKLENSNMESAILNNETYFRYVLLQR